MPLSKNIDEHFEKEVKPFLPDAFMNRSKDKIGYEISFSRHFYKYKSLRPSGEIFDEIIKLDKELEIVFQRFKNE